MEEKIKYEKPVVQTYDEQEIIRESAKLGNPCRYTCNGIPG